jgi:hypothetical protein
MKKRKNLKDVAELMSLYLNKFGIKEKMEPEKFAKLFWQGVQDKVSQGKRIILPMNLGYIQGLEHLYDGKDKEHLSKFGNLDYSVIWMKHPMFKYHSIATHDAVNGKIKEAKRKGVKILDNYVEGDFFII